MGTGTDKPSKIFADLDAFKLNWKPFAVADNTRVAMPPIRPIKPASKSGTGTSNTLSKGATGEAVKELRIRLAGFGGVLPGSSFDDGLEKAVKQFEKDVMSRTPTGIVDQAFAERLDKFAKDWPINFEKQLKCGCAKCKGYGDQNDKGKYSNPKSKLEMYHKYEYPGMHRSLLWGSRALMHYCTLDHKDSIRFSSFSCGYRCQENNKIHKRSSTNHMGKAVDMTFEGYRKDKWTRDIKKDLENVKKDANAIRDVAKKRLDAQIKWGESNRFSLEPGTGSVSAPTWVHLDVREWSSKHLDDSFFVKSQVDLDGDSMTAILSNTPTSGAAPHKEEAKEPQKPKSDSEVARPTTETEQLLAAVVYCESRSKNIGGEDADEKDAIAACFLNRMYYGTLSINNKRDFGTTLQKAIEIGSVAYRHATWNKVMDGDTMRDPAALESALKDSSDREHFKLSCDAAKRFAGKTGPIAISKLENSIPAAFNQAPNSPPGNGRLTKIGHLGAHTFYGFIKGRESQ